MLSEIKVVITKIANENQGAVTSDLLNAFGYYPVPTELSQWMDEQGYVIKGALDNPNADIPLTHEQELYLIGLAQNGDMNACWQLLSHFDDYIKRQVSYHTRCNGLYIADDINDIVQDVYIYAIEHINDYRIGTEARFHLFLNWSILSMRNKYMYNAYHRQGIIFNKKYQQIVKTSASKLFALGHYDFTDYTTDLIAQVAADNNVTIDDVRKAFDAYRLNVKNKSLITSLDYDQILAQNDIKCANTIPSLDDALINACTIADHPLFKAYLHIYNNMLTPYEQNLLHFANVHYDKYNTNAKKDMYTKLAAKYQNTDLLSNKHAVENLQYKIKSTLYKIIDADSKRKMLLEYAKEHNASKDVIDGLHVSAYKKTFMNAFNSDIDNYADVLDCIYDTYASDEYKASH